MTRMTFKQRLFAKIKVPTAPDGCWLWTAGTDRYGYGKVARDGRPVYAHRSVYEMYCGPLPPGMVLAHTCHTRRCVNPEHLRAATRAQSLQNRAGANKNSRTGVRGVFWDKRRGCWEVRVGSNGRLHFGGRFGSLDEAAEAARSLRNRLHTHSDTDE